MIIIKNLKAKLNRLLIPEGVTLKEEPNCTKYLVKKGVKTLVSATLPFLIKYIVDLQEPLYIPFAFGLFLHHRLFIESDILLESLIMKFKSPAPEISNTEQVINEKER